MTGYRYVMFATSGEFGSNDGHAWRSKEPILISPECSLVRPWDCADCHPSRYWGSAALGGVLLNVVALGLAFSWVICR